FILSVTLFYSEHIFTFRLNACISGGLLYFKWNFALHRDLYIQDMTGS
ncbi:hypothetical protein LSH36_64g02023, partial [Paralvinella palmiformis]